MSRIGKKPINIPDEVTVSVVDSELVVSGPKGELRQTIPPRLMVTVKDKKVFVERRGDSKSVKALHGLTARLIQNAIVGVTDGWNKELELVGTGYRASVQGDKLVLTIGFSHPVEVEIPEGVSISVEKNTKIIVSGIDKYLVGQVAANIRKLRPPEPYQGKGIKYAEEEIRRKPGKSAKGMEAAES